MANSEQTEPAGRELEVAVEREVFGNRVERTEDGNDWICPDLRTVQVSIDADGGRDFKEVPPVVPSYISSIAAAWEVVEKVTEGPWVFSVDDWGFHMNQPDDTRWNATFRHRERWYNEDNAWAVAFGSNLPEAICRAALAAVRADTEGADAE